MSGLEVNLPREPTSTLRADLVDTEADTVLEFTTRVMGFDRHLENYGHDHRGQILTWVDRNIIRLSSIDIDNGYLAIAMATSYFHGSVIEESCISYDFIKVLKGLKHEGSGMSHEDQETMRKMMADYKDGKLHPHLDRTASSFRDAFVGKIRVLFENPTVKLTPDQSNYFQKMFNLIENNTSASLAASGDPLKQAEITGGELGRLIGECLYLGVLSFDASVAGKNDKGPQNAPPPPPPPTSINPQPQGNVQSNFGMGQVNPSMQLLGGGMQNTPSLPAPGFGFANQLAGQNQNTMQNQGSNLQASLGLSSGMAGMLTNH